MTEAPGLENYEARWEKHWAEEGVNPGEKWDACASSPALVACLAEGAVDVKGARAFVPGCGRGYDLATFVRAGATSATGLEISPKAAEVANAYLAGELPEVPGHPEGGASVVVGDFFAPLDASLGSPFDVGYDYTFFCAMHPDARPRWARGWARALRQGGTLVALVVPVDPTADPTVGPPFPVSPELARSLLEPVGFELVRCEPVPPERSFPKRAGKEVLTVWTRKPDA